MSFKKKTCSWSSIYYFLNRNFLCLFCNCISSFVSKPFSLWNKCRLVLCWEFWDSACFYRWIVFDLFSSFLVLPAGPGDCIFLLAWNGGAVQSTGTPVEVKLKEWFNKWVGKKCTRFFRSSRWWMLGYTYRCVNVRQMSSDYILCVCMFVCIYRHKLQTKLILKCSL